MRKLTESKIVIASHNKGKVKEIAALLHPHHIKVVSAAELGLHEPEETASTFVGNAELKSRAAAIVSNMPALSDDSGLAVAALNGAPGIYSARWAGENKDFYHAMHFIERELKERGVTPEGQTAHFICALSMAWPNGDIVTVEGIVEGKLTFPPRGEKGFGYDPIFVPTGYDKTFAEMEPEAKHAISHRADAFSKLFSLLF